MEKSFEDYSLEELLQKGLPEAEELLRKGAPFHAGYVLSLIKDQYRGITYQYQTRKENIPPGATELQERITDLQDKIDRDIKDNCPIKIKELIEQKDFQGAKNQFVLLSTYYNKRHQKLPQKFLEFKNLIAAADGVDPLFAKVYHGGRFED